VTLRADQAIRLGEKIGVRTRLGEKKVARISMRSAASRALRISFRPD